MSGLSRSERCPTCGAAKGEFCTSAAGRLKHETHGLRARLVGLRTRGELPKETP